jgi:molybdopterin molybdotransferase
MDGYAVRGEPPWTLVGSALAGGEPAPPLHGGEALEIATGAPTPPGTTAVVPYEHATVRARTVTPRQPGTGRSHIRRTGEECPAGREVLPRGTVVTPAAVGLAASLGCDSLTVHAVPQVALLLTGDELARSGLPPQGRVRDALGPLLPGLVEWAGAAPRPVTYLPDGRAPLVTELARRTGRFGPQEPAPGTDVIAVCGASSRGPADHLRPALGELGAQLLVDSVACRPGHPQLLAQLPGGTYVVGLPGNPYAALAAAMTLLVPLLGTLAGRPAPTRRTARLARPLRTDPSRTRLVPVVVEDGLATPVGHDHPALLWGAALADALAVLPPGGADEVELLPLPR